MSSPIRIRLSGAALIAAIVVTSSLASAQEEPAATVPETVVTATRVPTPAARVASTIRVVTGEEIRRNQYRTVVEALDSLPGLTLVRSGGPGTTTSIFSRGANPNQTLVLIDGIEVNDPSTPAGTAELTHLLTEDVERIEVLYGSQGTLYGSDAIGAVVNIITRKGQGKPTGTAAVEGGSFETFNQFASVRGGGADHHYALGLQHLRVGGLSATTARLTAPGSVNDDDRYDNVTLSARAGYTASERLSLDVSARFTDADLDTDVNTTVPQSDNDSRSTAEQLFLRGDARLTLWDGRTQHRLGVAFSRFDRHDRDDPDPINTTDFLRDDNKGTRLKFEVQNDLRLVDHHVVTVGLETEEETIDSRLRSTSAFGFFDQSADAEARTYSAYLQDQFAYFDRLFGTVGVRIDDHETFGTEITWRVAPSYLVAETDTRIKGSYSTGFKAPSLFQLFGSSVSTFGLFSPNPNLQPEESRTWEIGLEQELFGGKLVAGATYFDTEVRNLIQSNATFTTNINIGRADLRGVEAFARVKPSEEVTVTLNYSYTAAEDAADGADLLRRPRNKASFDVAYRPLENLTLSAAGVYVGPRPDIEAVTFARVRQEGYLVVNLAASYSVGKHFRVFGRIENLFDRDYENPNGFTQPGFGAYAGVAARF